MRCWCHVFGVCVSFSGSVPTSNSGRITKSETSTPSSVARRRYSSTGSTCFHWRVRMGRAAPASSRRACSSSAACVTVMSRMGRPITMMTSCSAARPFSPAVRMMAAQTAPMDTAQNTDWRRGAASSWPLAIASITSAPESIEVMKNSVMTTSATTAATV